MYYRPLSDSANFYCDFPQITSVTADVSTVSCGLQCAQQPGCVLYAHDGGSCVLTQYIEGAPGTKAAFEMYAGWMMVEWWMRQQNKHSQDNIRCSEEFILFRQNIILQSWKSAMILTQFNYILTFYNDFWSVHTFWKKICWWTLLESC